MSAIFLVEDDQAIRSALTRSLSDRGHAVRTAARALDGLRDIVAWAPDVVVLDLGLPDLDGVEIVNQLRTWYGSPVVVVSARQQEGDKVKALDAGANDYLTKPFGTSELLARLRAALRQSHRIGAEPEQGVFVAGDLRVDRDRYEVTVRGQPVKLTPLEYRLLGTLIKYAGKVVTRRQLLREVWGETHAEEAHYLRVYMSSLRRKIEENPARPRYLVTEQNVGYRLRTD